MRVYLIIILGAAFLSLAACRSMSSAGKKTNESPTGESVRVYVNGTERGVTPLTLRVYRYRQELDIALKQGNETVRSYRIEETSSQNANELIYSFRANESRDELSFTTEDLPTKDKKLYVIPYVDDRLTVEDNQYDLTLIVMN